MKSVNANRSVILASILKAVSAGQQKLFPQNSLHLLTAFNFPNSLPSMSSRLLGWRCSSPQREGYKHLVLRSFNSVTCLTVSSFHQGEICCVPLGIWSPNPGDPTLLFWVTYMMVWIHGWVFSGWFWLRQGKDKETFPPDLWRDQRDRRRCILVGTKIMPIADGFW